jgi:hypothetical protein
MNNDSVYQSIPPWVRLFLVHVVKRCCGIIVKWIDDMQSSCLEERTGGDGYLHQR